MLDDAGDTNPAIWRGTLKIETYTRQSAANEQATATLYAIVARQTYLITGSAAQGLPQLRGTQVSPDWYVSGCKPKMPTGRIPSALDATIRRYISTYEAILNNSSVGYPS